MRFQHFVITRFSHRIDRSGPDAEFLDRIRPSREGEYDPLDPAKLDQRLRLFEVICAPGVAAQTCKNFTWVLVIDRQLPPEYRERVAALANRHPHTVLHEYDPTSSTRGTKWLKPYITEPAPDHLLTTLLDDDDGLPRRFAEELQRWVTERGDDAAPIEFFGATDAVEWDLAVERRAPRGYWADWHRDEVPVPSCGVSMLARYPDYPLAITGVHHGATNKLLDWSYSFGDYKRFTRLRALIEELADAAGDRLQDYDPRDTFHDTVERIGRPLMANHGDNGQGFRLYEKKNRIPVTGPEYWRVLPSGKVMATLPPAGADSAISDIFLSISGALRRL